MFLGRGSRQPGSLLTRFWVGVIGDLRLSTEPRLRRERWCGPRQRSWTLRPQGRCGSSRSTSSSRLRARASWDCWRVFRATEASTTTTAPETTTTAPETTTTVPEPTGGGIASVGRLTAEYTYTSAGRLATANIDLAGNEEPDGFVESYTFDPAGNLTSVGEGTTLTYEENRLATMTAGGSTTYFFFDAGQRWRTGQAPSANVDAEGRPTDPDRTTFAYTGTGRLAEYVQYQNGDKSVSATYAYDAAGQRTSSVVKTYLGGQEQTSTTTDFTYTGLTLHKLSATRTGGADPGSWTITYLYDEYGRPYAGVYRDTSTTPTPAPVVFGLLTTDRGDVVSLLDAEGAPFAAYRYDAWGNPLGEGNLGTGLWTQETTLVSVDLAAQISERQVLRYAGYCYDQESGMYYLSARHYDPETRQFLSKDLSRNDGEQSAYQYCLGNPVGNVDPSGLAPMKLMKFSATTAPVVTRVAFPNNTSGLVEFGDELDDIGEDERLYAAWLLQNHLESRLNGSRAAPGTGLACAWNYVATPFAAMMAYAETYKEIAALMETKGAWDLVQADNGVSAELQNMTWHGRPISREEYNNHKYGEMFAYLNLSASLMLGLSEAEAEAIGEDPTDEAGDWELMVEGYVVTQYTLDNIADTVLPDGYVPHYHSWQ
jgi:RHS repeat-associated protein